MKEKLSLKTLNKIKNGSVFAKGLGYYPDLRKKFPVRWIAIKLSQDNKWVILLGDTNKDDVFLINENKVLTSQLHIKDFVPCDKEVYSCYKF